MRKSWLLIINLLLLAACGKTIVPTPLPSETPTATNDCPNVVHYLPDLPEAQQIVEEFITNFKKDFPTEYMAFEQLWAVDKLGDYAAIQGRVTQEESDIIVVRQMERGFVMVARYHTHMVLPEPRRLTIPEYLIGQLPDAPPELFHCLDLSRYVGESNQ